MGRSRRPFNNPFAAQREALKKSLKSRGKAKRSAKQEPAPRPAAVPPSPPASDEDLFRAAVQGIEPVQDPRGVVRPPLPPKTAEHVAVYDEDAEVLAQLADLVAGDAHFDISHSDEFIEGAADGLDRRILRRLKRGEFAFRGHLDLHGLTRDEAKAAVEQFIAERRRAGHRCVLIIHGRGLNSKDQIPVLKSHLRLWLERGRIARAVLAFCTARPHDGGAGAVYVLLRK